METINYILLSVVSYTGLFCGVVLAFIAPEEQRPGRNYFLFAQKILLGTIVMVLLTLNPNIYTLAISVILLTMIFFRNLNNYVAYFLFVPALYLSINNTPLILIVSTQVFLYGMLTGTLIVQPKKLNEAVKSCLRFAYYPLILFFIFILPLVSSYFKIS